MPWFCVRATPLGPWVAAGPLEAAASALHEDTGLFSRLGKHHLGGAAAAPTAGGAVATSVARGGAPERTAKRRAARELRGGALVSLAGDVGVGRKRVSPSPESVSLGDKCKICVPAPVLPSDSGCGLTQNVAIESWLPRRRENSAVHVTDRLGKPQSRPLA